MNEGKFFNGWPDEIADNLALIDELGTPNTHNHYPTGWAVAFSTPFRMFKRYVYQGGVCDPLVIFWPNGIKARGEVRNQYHHCTDIVPTILDACGVQMPSGVNGVEQHPLSGVLMRYSFDEADAPTRKETQYYEMLGQRGIWHQGWKAVAKHGPISGMSNFDKDRWQLFHTDEDRSEMHDLSDQHLAKVRELVDLWMREAEANNVLPLNDMQVTGKDLPTFMKLMFQVPVPHSGRYVYYPGTSPIPEKNAANNHAVSFKILAEVVIEVGTQGVIFAQGSRFGGHALYVKDGKVSYVHNFLGIPPMQVLKPRCRLPADTSSESNSPGSDPASTTKPTGRRRCTSTKPLATQALDSRHWPACAGRHPVVDQIIDERWGSMSETVNGWRGSLASGRCSYDWPLNAANTKYQVGTELADQVVYLNAKVDADNQPLSGDNNYVLHFEPGQTPPVAGMWNIAMYDESMLFVANDIDRFSIGSTTDGLTPKADASLTIYIQHSQPVDDCAANWLPTPIGSFNLTMRFYTPLTPVLDKSYRLPVQKVE